MVTLRQNDIYFLVLFVADKHVDICYLTLSKQIHTQMSKQYPNDVNWLPCFVLICKFRPFANSSKKTHSISVWEDFEITWQVFSVNYSGMQRKKWSKFLFNFLKLTSSVIYFYLIFKTFNQRSSMGTVWHLLSQNIAAIITWWWLKS